MQLMDPSYRVFGSLKDTKPCKVLHTCTEWMPSMTMMRDIDFLIIVRAISNPIIHL
jgi:hypothetical protein